MRTACAIALLTIFGAPARAELTAEQVAHFVKTESRLNESYQGDKAVIYRMLAGASPAAPHPAAALRLGKLWAIPQSTAADVIEALVISEDRKPAVLGGAGDSRAASLFRSAVNGAPDSPQVWGMAIEFWADQGECGDTRLRDQYFARPVAADHYLDLGECENWMPEFLRLNPQRLAGRFALVDYLQDRDPASALAASRWLLDAFPKRNGALPEAAELAAIRQLWKLLDINGLSDELLADADGRSAKELDAILRQQSKAEVRVDGRVAVTADAAQKYRTAARRAWLLTLILAGRTAEARAAYDSRLDGNGLMRDVLVGKATEDIFDRYAGDGENGLLWQDAGEGVQSMRVGAQFLDANQFPSAARKLESDACKGGYQHLAEEDRRQLRALPPEYSAYAERFRQLLVMRDERARCPARGPDQEMASRLTRYAETALTEAEKALPELRNAEIKVPLPASFELVRSERAGLEILAVCISAAVDPAGEVSRGGYWLLRSRDGGQNWLAPLYLGFQQHAPYVVRDEARLSMFSPTALRLEVDVEELDPSSITFPPVGLTLRREAHDVYIEIPLSELEKDSDGDGLHDLLEVKLQTNPLLADTDGDGIGDRFDDFPQVSARAAPHPLAQLVVEVLKKLGGYERAGIIEPVRKADERTLAFPRDLEHSGMGSLLFQFIEGDVSLFTGLRAEGQTIVVNAAQIAELQARFGPFYPLSFPAILIDGAGNRALVKWSAGWVGGTVIYRRTNGRWKGKDVGSWITRAPRSIAHTSPG